MTAGVAIIVWPDLSLRAIVTVFGVYAVLEGLLRLAGVPFGKRRRWQSAAHTPTPASRWVPAHSFTRTRARTAVLYLLAVWVVVMAAVRLGAKVDFRNGVVVH